MNIDSLTKEEFKQFLQQKSDDYYTGESSISDKDFDLYTTIYENRFNEPFYYLGPSGKVKLPVLMPSLNKCKDDISTVSGRSLNNFKESCSAKLIVTEKLDGYSCLIEFKLRNNDLIINLYNRGDGIYGNNISDIQNHINLFFSQSQISNTDTALAFSERSESQRDAKENIKHYLKYKNKYNSSLFVRGELVMPFTSFEKYKHKFSNPRNIVAGIINSKHKDIEMLNELIFVAHSIPNTHLNTFEEVFDLLTHLYFYLPIREVYDSYEINKNKLISIFKQREKMVDYLIDGLVISDNIIH
jgi:DNA ligase (NAD+)